ncbi:MAG: type II toxin-antitoxin system PemK/MazF family toxin [Chloroflexota bacterium]
MWLVELPNQPRDTHTPRPALVMSIDVRNRLAGDVLVVPLSTNLRPLTTHVLLPARTAGLQHDSMAKCEQITTLDKLFLTGGPLGERVQSDLLDRVVRAVQRAIGADLAL